MTQTTQEFGARKSPRLTARTLALFVAIAALGGCGGSTELRADVVQADSAGTASTSATPTSTVPTSTVAVTTAAPVTETTIAAPAPTEPPPPPAPTGLDPNGLTTDGVAPLRIGDPLSKMLELTGGRYEPSRCEGLDWVTGGPEGLALGTDGETFTQYHTEDPRYTTPSGARVGMTVAEVQAAIPYAKREMGPHNVDALIVRSEGNVLIFAISEGRIMQINGGLESAAGWGC